MSLARLRAGEWLALVGAVGLVVLLFLSWFGIELPAGSSWGVADRSGWSSLGVPALVLAVLAIVAALTVVVATALGQPPAWTVGASVVTAAVGTLAVLALVIRVALAQPDLGANVPDELVDVRLPAVLGLVAAALMPAGAWRAMGDERLTAPESAVTPPPARPAPEV